MRSGSSSPVAIAMARWVSKRSRSGAASPLRKLVMVPAPATQTCRRAQFPAA